MTEVIHTTTLGNGLRVVSEEIPGALSTSLGAWVVVGSRDEAPEESGASHFLEDLLFKGTAARSAFEVAEAIDSVGGDMNAFTAREHTAFYARVPAAASTMASELLFDVIRDPALRPADVAAERQVIAEELTAAVTTPDDLVFMMLYDALFDGHSLGREVLGEPSTIMALQPDEIADFHRRWYLPENIVVAAAGVVDHGELVEAATKSFGDMAMGARPSRFAPDEPQGRTIATALPVEQLHVAIGWRSLPHDHDDRYALAVANQILGATPSSRLFQSIREERSLAYTVYSSTSGYADVGSAIIYAATAATRGPELLTALRNEVERFVESGVTQRELDLARTGFEGAILLGLEDSGSRMVRIANGIALRGAVVPIDAFLERLDQVSVEDVNRVIGHVFGGVAVTSLVGPQDALDACYPVIGDRLPSMG